MNHLALSVSVPDMELMSKAIALSGLFGIRDQNQALALMIVAAAEGRHPGKVATEYHIIQGRATLKADTMLARFQESGGRVEWHSYTDECVDATFSHPSGTVRLDWTMERARKANLANKDIWRQYPRAMLRARVISEGVRTVLPGVLGGMYTPEEVRDFSGDHSRAESEMEAEDVRREEDSRANAGPTQLMDAPAILPPADPWDALVHFGKVIRGKTLRELSNEQREWLFDTWLKDFDSSDRPRSQLDHDLADAIRRAAPLAKDASPQSTAEAATVIAPVQTPKPEDETQEPVEDLDHLRAKLAEAPTVEEAEFIGYLRLSKRKASGPVLEVDQDLSALMGPDLVQIVMRLPKMKAELIDLRRKAQKDQLLANTP